jgi:hypothetical protein
VKQLLNSERDCALTLDEMAITPQIEFDATSGRMLGEVTLPGHTGRATHALVFMLSGISLIFIL